MEEELKLIYDFNAIEKLYEKGLDLLGGTLTDSDFRKPPNIVLMIWAGSLHKLPDLTVDEARAQISRGNVKDLVKRITSNLKDSLGVTEEEVDAALAEEAKGETDEGSPEPESKSSSPEDQS